MRTWADGVDEEFIESIAQSIRDSERRVAAMPESERPKTIDLLALSGGADDGAYGAGLLCGWTERGDRPVFQLVTGVSTGALIAPLAFLGSDYDAVLREAYTAIDIDDVTQTRALLNAVFSDGLADTDPLGNLIQKWVTSDMLAAIAREHQAGRRLFIQTVNLETQRGVIWDMGAIASSGHPRAEGLFRQIMLASASVPAAFEPQYVEVDVAGEKYEELHVDGGTATQVFLWGVGVTVRDLSRRAGQEGGPPVPVHLWLVRNGRLYPEHQEMDGELFSITGRAVSTLLKAQSLADVSRLALVAEANDIEYHLTSISPEFGEHDKDLFEPGYMNRLFEFGLQQIKRDAAWSGRPPLIDQLLGR